jgi:hypothetical protein
MVAEDGRVNEPLQDGYDSYYVPVEDVQQDGYYHEYCIKQTAQILPQYLVTFEYDPVKEKQAREVRPS